MSIEAIRSAKTELRRVMRQTRADMSARERHAASQAICARLLTLLPSDEDSHPTEEAMRHRCDLARHGAIAVYLATEKEACVDAFVRQLWERETRVAAPVARIEEGANGLDFFALRDLESVRLGAFDVREPHVADDEKALALPDIAVFLVPGIAFGRDGSRLGQGGGFYDRVLESARDSGALTIGVCFDCQLVESVPREEHDWKVALIVSEKQLIRA